MAIGEITLKRWTSEEFSQLGEFGLLGSERAELIDGDIFMMSPQGPRHAVVVSLLAQALQACLPAGYHLRVQMPLDLNSLSAPEPDLAIVTGEPRDYLSKHPTTAVLVIEVSDSTLDHDRGTKEPIYAAGGIEEYWLINLVAGNVEIRRQASPTGYLDLRTLTAGETLTAVRIPEIRIHIDAILP